MVTGGQRSGKSVFAEALALSLSPNPVYMATARVLDDDMRERVRLHRLRRGEHWTNIEETMYPSRHDISGRVVLMDCVTLWAMNHFFACVDDNVCSLKNLIAEFDRFTKDDATFIFVTNEIGLGGISSNTMQRHFTDLQGSINQYIAGKADDVYLLVSGIEIKIK